MDLERAIDEHLPSIVRRADLQTSTIAMLHRELEIVLATSLETKKAYVREQVRG